MINQNYKPRTLIIPKKIMIWKNDYFQMKILTGTSKSTFLTTYVWALNLKLNRSQILPKFLTKTCNLIWQGYAAFSGVNLLKELFLPTLYHCAYHQNFVVLWHKQTSHYIKLLPIPLSRLCRFFVEYVLQKQMLLAR